MAFVPRYEHDLFVSYATIDDDPLIPDDDGSRWVRTLKNNLQTLLDQKLGRRGSATVWMDIGRLQGNEPLSPDIHQAISKTAVLLIVLSEGYLASDWCRQEREAFVKMAREARDEGRIFVVHRDEIPREQWPSEFSDLLGYPFYEKDPSDGSVRTLAIPKPDPGERTYYSRLDRLRSDIARKLHELKEKPDKPISVDAKAAGTSETKPTDASAPVVFIAETTPDLVEAREQVSSYLRQSGFQILPRQYYDRGLETFQQQTDSDLAECLLFVQLLGPYPSWRTEKLSSGYDGLQLQRARAAAVPIQRWRSRELDLASVHDEQHRGTLQADDVVAMDIEEFKRTICDRARKIQSQQRAVVETAEGDVFVLVSAATNDLALADGIASRLESRNIGYDIIDEDTPIVDVTEADDYDGVMIVYGGTHQTWVQQRVRECRRVALNKKSNAPVCGVFIGPPTDKPPLRSRPPRFYVIDDDDAQRFGEFVDALASKRTPQ